MITGLNRCIAALSTGIVMGNTGNKGPRERASETPSTASHEHRFVSGTDLQIAVTLRRTLQPVNHLVWRPALP